MEKVSPQNDEQLFDYLDGLLNEQQSKQVEMLLQESPSMKSRLEELKTIRGALTAAARLENPSKNFTAHVMDHLDSYPIPTGFSPRNGILLLSGIIVAIGIGLILLRAGIFNTAAVPISFDALPIKEEWTKNFLPTISFNFNSKLFMNALLIIAMGVSFVLLDKTILRPLFGKRSGIQF